MVAALRGFYYIKVVDMSITVTVACVQMDAKNSSPLKSLKPDSSTRRCSIVFQLRYMHMLVHIAACTSIHTHMCLHTHMLAV